MYWDLSFERKQRKGEVGEQPQRGVWKPYTNYIAKLGEGRKRPGESGCFNGTLRRQAGRSLSAPSRIVAAGPPGATSGQRVIRPECLRGAD